MVETETPSWIIFQIEFSALDEIEEELVLMMEFP
jgi:hypothetical protein